MNIYYIAGYPVSDSLYHHGIKGQQWGVQNGPPYPLGSDITKRIKAKADKLKTNPVKKKEDGTFSIELNEDQKKAIKIGVAVIGGLYLECKYHTISGTVTAIATAVETDPTIYQNSAEGTYPPKLSRTNAYINKRDRNDNVDPKTQLHKIVGEHSEQDDLYSVNKDFSLLNSKTSQNCGLCATAFEMRRRGYDVVAGFSNTGLLEKDIKKSFLGAHSKNRTDGIIGFLLRNGGGLDEASAEDVINSFKSEKNTRGMLTVRWANSSTGHAINYSVDSNGNITIYDSQVGKSYTGDEAKRFFMKVSNCESYRLDNTTINVNYMRKHNLIL